MENAGIIIFLIVLAVISIIAIAFSSSRGKGSSSMSSTQDIRRYNNDEKILSQAVSSNSPNKVRQAISDFESGRASSSGNVRRLYEQDIRDLKTHLTAIEDDKWQRKADVYVQKVIDDFYTITTRELESFNDVELMFQVRSSCLRNWKKYYEIDIPRNQSKSVQRDYMREAFGSDYDPCLDSYESLESKLSEYTDSMRPVLVRKKKLLKTMMEAVAEVGTIKKADFLRTNYDGYTEKEVQCCYRVLIKKNVLTEIKIGNRLFVMLSDKEKAKRGIPVTGSDANTILLGAGDMDKALLMVKDKYRENECPHLNEVYDTDVEKKWYSRVRKKLELFRKCYLLITRDEYDNLDGELLLKLKKKCIDQWQSYFSHNLEQYNVTIYPKRYLRKWMGKEYASCMEDHYKLENELVKHIKQKRPENRRVTALYSAIIDYIKEHPDLSQERALTVKIEGYSADEIDCALKDLLRKGQLEIKKNGGESVLCVPKE